MQQHDLFDRLSRQWSDRHVASGRTIYCRQGCSGCCNLAVHAVYSEAVQVAKSLSSHQVELINDYVKSLKQFLPEAKGLKDYLKLHREHVERCPFLDDNGDCGIYSKRPLSCRALLSTRPPEWCTVDFAQLDAWDLKVFESGLDKDVVAWPTHYVAATQELARELEIQLCKEMTTTHGWSLKGNFASMVWLEKSFGLSLHNNNKEQV